MLPTTTRNLVVLVVLAVLFGSQAMTPRALGQRTVGDICRVKGMEEIQLQGIGIVVGLNGTGDGGSFAPLGRSLARTMELLGNPVVDMNELKSAKNIALVMITATVAATGGMQGDRIDCVVSSMGSAKSLEGGRLMLSPLVGPLPIPDGKAEVFAFAEGLLTVESPETPTSARVNRGCRLEVNLRPVFTQDGKTITLVIHNQFAGFQTAMEVVTAVNDENLTTLTGGQPLAHAVNAKVITVTLPEAYQENFADRGEPADLVFIVAMIMRQELKLPLIAKRVFINERAQSINICGDVTIAPCLINHQGMAIEITGGSGFVSMDVDDPENPKLKTLLSVLNAVSQSTEVAIQVIKDLDNNGNLYGELVIE